MKYPKELKISTNTNGYLVSLTFPEKRECDHCYKVITISSTDANKEQSLKQHVRNEAEFKNVIIGNEPGLVGDIPSQAYGYGGYVIHKNKFYEIAAFVFGGDPEGKEEAINVLDNILTTIKFD